MCAALKRTLYRNILVLQRILHVTCGALSTDLVIGMIQVEHIFDRCLIKANNTVEESYKRSDSKQVIVALSLLVLLTGYILACNS